MAPLLASLLAGVDCKPSASAVEACTDFPPRCEEELLTVCNAGAVSRLDCAFKGLKCLLDAKGEARCAEPCPSTLDGYGACKGTHLLTCDGEALVDIACDEAGMKCGYMIEGHASCTKPCPDFVDGLGACTGTGLRRCNGQVFFDLNCLDVKLFCGTTADGIAQCTDPCPEGVDTFGVCDGEVAKRCDGSVYKEEDCGEVGKKCEQLDRFGVGCRGCTSTQSSGACSATWGITTCTAAGREIHQSCVARGGTCGFSEAECRSACLDTVPAGSCAAAKLAEGEKRCRENPFTHFHSIQTCAGGRVVETECPAASDGSVACVAVGGEPRCETTCGPSGRRCTDRGVLVACTTAGLAWIDCAEFGAECTDVGTDAFCACTEVPERSARCAADKRGWEVGYGDPPIEDAGATPVLDAGAPAAPDAGPAPSFEYVCVDGRITVKPCACAPP